MERILSNRTALNPQIKEAVAIVDIYTILPDKIQSRLLSYYRQALPIPQHLIYESDRQHYITNSRNANRILPLLRKIEKKI